VGRGDTCPGERNVWLWGGLLIGALCLLYFGFLGTIPLMEPDEGRYAEIPREMLADGNFVTAHQAGVAYVEKPPLYYWGTALSLSLFGINEFGARAFGTAMAIGGVLLTYWMGAVLGGRRTGLFAALVLATSPLYYILGRLTTMDMTLAVFLTLAIISGYLVLARGRGRVYLYLAYVGVALAFLAKGLVAVAFPAAILVLWAVSRWRWRELSRLFSPVGIGIMLALVLPWLLAVRRENPDFFWYFFIHEHVMRYTSTMHGRSRPFWYLLPFVPLGVLPWLPLVGRAWKMTRDWAGSELERADRWFLWTWIGFILLFYGTSHSQLITYIVPVFPPLAVLCGARLAGWNKGTDAAPIRLQLGVGIALAATLAVLPFVARDFAIGALGIGGWLATIAVPGLAILAWGAVPLRLARLGPQRTVLVSAGLLAVFWLALNPAIAVSIGEQRSGKSLAMAIKREWQPGDIVAQRGPYVQSVPFYLGQLTLVVGEHREQDYGRAKITPEQRKWFPDEAGLRRLWASDRRMFCIFEQDAMDDIEKYYPGARLLARSPRGILVSNR